MTLLFSTNQKNEIKISFKTLHKLSYYGKNGNRWLEFSSFNLENFVKRGMISL